MRKRHKQFDHACPRVTWKGCLQGGEEVRGPLTEDELQRLRQCVDTYVSDKSPDAVLRAGGSMMFINAAFQALKDLARSAHRPHQAAATPVTASQSPNPNVPSAGTEPGGSVPDNGPGASVTGTPAEGLAEVANKGILALREENGKLRLQVKQRDNEINILVSMLKKREATIAAAAAASTGAAGGSSANRLETAEQPEGGPAHGGSAALAAGLESGQVGMGGAAGDGDGCGAAGVAGKDRSAEAGDAALLDLSALSDRNRAFEMFRKSYRRNAAIESSKSVRLAPRANGMSRYHSISHVQASMRRHRRGGVSCGVPARDTLGYYACILMLEFMMCRS